MRKLVVLVLAVLTLVLLVPATASASTLTLKSLATKVAALQKQVTTQKAKIKTLSTQLTAAQSVLALAPYVSLDPNAENGVAGPNIVFQGANVTVRSSQTNGDGTGTGNLIVGWDEVPSPAPSPLRTGDNNLVCGNDNNFTSSGGFVAGYLNTVSGAEASVSGGRLNVASDQCSSISGGYNNFSDAFCSSVSGGDNNHASGLYSSASGGYVNTASGTYSSVSGGAFGIANDHATSVSGGYGGIAGDGTGGPNAATGDYSNVSGGYDNWATGGYAAVSGGDFLTESTTYGWMGGTYHTP